MSPRLSPGAQLPLKSHQSFFSLTSTLKSGPSHCLPPNLEVPGLAPPSNHTKQDGGDLGLRTLRDELGRGLGMLGCSIDYVGRDLVRLSLLHFSNLQLTGRIDES